VLKDQNSY